MFTLKTDLPFFQGFYESILENSDTAYYAIENDIEYCRKELGEERDYNDYEFDTYRRRQDICLAYCANFEEMSPSFVTKVIYDSISSPREYNFRTDELIAQIVFADNWREEILKFMRENKEELSKEIYNDWTSRDGFWSFMPNHYDAWYAEFEKAEEDIDENFISVMLKYIMEMGNPEIENDLNYYSIEDICDSEYLSYVGK